MLAKGHWSATIDHIDLSTCGFIQSQEYLLGQSLKNIDALHLNIDCVVFTFLRNPV